MILFLLMNAIVIYSAYLIVGKVFKVKNFVDFIIAWLIVYFSQIILTQTLLGVAGVLYLGNVIALNALIMFLVVFLTRKNKVDFKMDQVKASCKELLANKTVLLISSIIIAFGIVKVSINFINPPFGWDCLNYHFTYPVEWIKNGNLINPPTVFGDPSPSYYPMNGSLFFLWFIFPFKSALIADLGQIPFFLISILAIYRISRQVGLSKEYSFYASTLFLLIPNYFKQLEIAYIDVMVAALFLVCLHYILLLRRRFLIKEVFLFSASLGLLLGTKTVALPYSILLLIPLVYLSLKNIKKIPLVFLVLLVSLISLGGLTYIRNFIYTNNPLYPFDFKILGKTIFQGVMNKATYGAHFTIEDYSLSKLLFHEGLSGQGIVFIFLPVLLSLPIYIIKKRKKCDFLVSYILLTPILMYLIYRFIIPLANTRYLYGFLGLGMILGFFFFNLISLPRVIVISLSAIAALAAMSTLGSHGELVTGIVSSLFLFGTLLFLDKKINLIEKILTKKVFIWALIIGILSVSLGNIYYNRTEGDRYVSMEEYSGFWPDATRAWKWINDNTDKNNIAYVGRPVPFPLYGSQFKNNVYYVSVNEIEPAKLHYFKDSYYSWGSEFEEMHEAFKKKGNYRQNPQYSLWLKNLLKAKTDYLFIYSLQHTKTVIFPLEYEWVRSKPDVFKEVFSNKTIHIYKVLK